MWTPKSSSGLLRTALPGPQDSDLLLIYPLDKGVVTTEPRSWDFGGEGRNATENGRVRSHCDKSEHSSES